MTFTRSTAPPDTFMSGSLTWTSGSTVVRIPIAVQPVTSAARANASATGVTGSTAITVTPGGTGDIPLASTGLAKGVLQPDPTGKEKTHSGSGVTNDSFEYRVVVPQGASFARFDLDSIDNTADLDLTTLLLDASGTPIGGYQSATGSADERIDFQAPDAGTYVITVDVYTANPATAFGLRTYIVGPAAGSPLALTPAVLTAHQGIPITYTASWAGLDPRSTYLAHIAYGDTGATTVLEVITGEPAPIATTLPKITGKPAVGKVLRASPGKWDVTGLTFSYQWVVDGVPIPGAVTSRYKVTSSDQGRAVTVTVTATKTGLPSGTATSGPVTIVFDTKTRLELNPVSIRPSQTVTATVTVSSSSTTAATGKLSVWVDGKRMSDVRVTTAQAGVVVFALPRFRSGIHRVSVDFVPDTAAYVGSQSRTRFWGVIR